MPIFLQKGKQVLYTEIMMGISNLVWMSLFRYSYYSCFRGQIKPNIGTNSK